jgi:hypothetical protein
MGATLIAGAAAVTLDLGDANGSAPGAPFGFLG